MEIKLNLIGGFFWEVQSSRHDETKLSIKFLSLFRFLKKKKKRENKSHKLWILKKIYFLFVSIFNFEWIIIIIIITFYFYLILFFLKQISNSDTFFSILYKQ